jgi:hypothetical protein
MPHPHGAQQRIAVLNRAIANREAVVAALEVERQEFEITPGYQRYLTVLRSVISHLTRRAELVAERDKLQAAIDQH